MQAVNRSPTVQDLVSPSKTMFKEIAALIMPKFRIEYTNIEMPQDNLINLEEQKVQLSPEQKLIALIRQVEREIALKTDIIEIDFQNLTKQ